MTPISIYLGLQRYQPGATSAVDAMVPWLRKHSATSRSHAWGWEAEAAEKARSQAADLIRRRPARNRWTRCHQINNLAIRCEAHFYQAWARTSITRQDRALRAVLDTCREWNARALR